MKSTIQILVILSLYSKLFAQDQKLDSICVSLIRQEFALNELISEDIKFCSLKKSDKIKSGITVKVQVLDNSYFFLSNWVLKHDTVTAPSRSGKITTEILRGTDYVLGNKLIIYNNTSNSIRIPIEDNQLILVQEAKDQKGNWKPVEYFMHSTCGNSYSSLQVPNQKSCQFMIIKYCGEFKTKMRVRICLNNDTYFSNEFDGYVNSQQFNTPSGIPQEGLF